MKNRNIRGCGTRDENTNAGHVASKITDCERAKRKGHVGRTRTDSLEEYRHRRTVGHSAEGNYMKEGEARQGGETKEGTERERR